MLAPTTATSNAPRRISVLAPIAILTHGHTRASPLRGLVTGRDVGHPQWRLPCLHLVRRLGLAVEQRTDIKRFTVAAASGAQPFPHRLGSGDERVDLGQLASS